MERVLMTKTTIAVVQRSEHFSVRRRCEVVSEQFQKDSPSADKISVKTQIYMKRLTSIIICGGKLCKVVSHS